MITSLPKADSTDFYMFQSYDDDDIANNDKTVLIGNFHPLQDAFGGPMYFFMDEPAIYEIHIDNNGDAREDITFRFQFQNDFQNYTVPVNPTTDVEIPLLTLPGQIDKPKDEDLNIIEQYTVEIHVHSGAGAPRVIQALNTSSGSPNDPNFIKPADYFSSQVFPDYNGYANQHIYDFTAPQFGDGRVFVGQRADPFYVDLDAVFDLINQNGRPASEVIPSNSMEAKNITSFCLEVPTALLTGGAEVEAIGAWTTASLPQTRRLLPPVIGQPFAPAQQAGDFVQVSRLGNPLVNELVIGVGEKDRFNASHPADDQANGFDHFYLNSSLAALLAPASSPPAPADNRFDLLNLFATGFGGVNQTGGIGEMLRLGINTPPTPLNRQNALGHLANPPDLAGFPNGRRPGDDVVDIILSLINGAFAVPNAQPVSDGVAIGVAGLPAEFPFLSPPTPGDAPKVCVTIESTASLQGPFQQVPAAPHPSKPGTVIARKQPGDAWFFRAATDARVEIDIKEFRIGNSGQEVEIDLGKK